MEFSQQEYWSGLPFPSPRDLPDPGMKPGSPALQADSLPIELPGTHNILGTLSTHHNINSEKLKNMTLVTLRKILCLSHVF